MSARNPPVPQKESVPDTHDFDCELEAHDLAGFWNARVPMHRPEPPMLWKWGPVRDGLVKAAATISMEFAERRVIKLVNPALPSNAASRSIQFNFSIVNPGEIARAHRHNIGAVRFVVEGKGAWTTVEGERFAMEPGDLILTPNWTFHDHANESSEPIIWLDGLDGPLIQALNVSLFETYPEATQPVRGAGTEREVGTTGVPHRFPWAGAYATVSAMTAEDDDPFDGARLRYADPVSGGDTLPTLGCELTRLAPGRKTQRHRHTSVALYHVVSGRGRTTVGEETIEWERGDTFVVPLWLWHSHENPNRDEAVLFSMNDRPAMQALRLYREEH